ncbi:MAG: lipoyl(octanoyl) transferase [Phycisphaerae bacterium]|nr:lipoyl(octanoyl) transferase [Phycisphaerae bacterium]
MNLSPASSAGDTPGCQSLVVTDLGRLSYGEALEIQRQRQAEVIAARTQGRALGYLLLVEHDPPVITVSGRPGAGDHLLADPARLEAAGVTVEKTDRGGDITYHGPGQLVAYPILDLNSLDLRLHGYLRWLEQRAMDTLGDFGIDAHRDPAATGAWVGGEEHEGARTGNRKICAIGVRVSRWVSMHGLAINVSTDLSHFNFIVPCGLTGRPVTSMESELGEGCPAMSQVKESLVNRFREAIGCPGPVPPGHRS